MLSAAAARPDAHLEALPVAAYSCDAHGRITAYNARAAALWGRRPRLGDPDCRYCGSVELLSAAGAALPHEHSPMARVLRDGAACEAEQVVIVRPDDSRRTVSVSALPFFEAGKGLAGATAVLVDITEAAERQHATEQALHAMEASFRGFFDSAAVGAVQVDAQGRFIRVNDRYCEITGYSREELLSMGPFDLDHPDDRKQDLELVMQVIADPAGIYHTEKRYVRKDGTVGWVHVAANMVRGEGARPIQSAAIIMDITERKRTEQALQDADRAKDDFLAMLAHELRNPLAPLRNTMELLRHPDVKDTKWCQEIIARQVNHLSRLIDDLLDVSRITRDKLELRKTRIDLADALNAAIEASRPMLDRCEQKLVVESPRKGMFLDGDLVRLTQVFTNLLTNAAKFSDRAGTIRLTTAREGGTVRVGIADSGIGIASDELTRVFEKFYQGARRGKGSLEGLGIGLALVRRLVSSHGGTVEAYSAGLGRGSEFVVRLPVENAPASALSQPATQARAVADGKRIMVVDDNTDGADSLCRLLELMGHEAEAAYDGHSALERARTFAPHVILLDLGMPGLDGFEVCRRLREAPASSRPDVVAITGWGREEDRERTKTAGFDAHLVKPVDRIALENLLGGGSPSL